MVKISWTRDEAEACLDAAIREWARQPDPHLREAIFALAVACGMVKDGPQLEERLYDWFYDQLLGNV